MWHPGQEQLHIEPGKLLFQQKYNLCSKIALKNNFYYWYSQVSDILHNRLLVSSWHICFPSGNSGKEPACQCWRLKRQGFDPWVGKIPGEGNGKLLWYRIPWKWESGELQSMGLQRVWYNWTQTQHMGHLLGTWHRKLAAASLQLCLTLCDPIDSSQPGFPSLGFSRQEHWSGLPFPSPIHESEKWKWSRSVVSNSSDPMNCSLPGSSVHGIF